MKTVYTNEEKNELESLWWKHLDERNNLDLIETKNKEYQEYCNYCNMFLTLDDSLSILLQKRYGLETGAKIFEMLKKLKKDYYFPDNFRVAIVSNKKEMEEYIAVQRDGCCGFYDEEIEIDDKKFKIGFNYGH